MPEQVANLDFIAFPAREVGQILVDRIAQGDKPAPAAEGDSGFNWAKSEPASTPAPKTLISACAIYFCFDSVDRALGRHIADSGSHRPSRMGISPSLRLYASKTVMD